MHNKNISFLVFSDDWGEHPSSCQHLFKYISREYPTLWVNTIGMRTPKLDRADLQKALLKLKRMFSTTNSSVTAIDNTNIHPLLLTVCQPKMLPFLVVPGCRLLNRKSVEMTVKNKMKELGMQNPISIVTAPNASDYVGLFGEKKIVYYCVDDYGEWPGLEHTIVREMEEKLISKADIFFATADKLFNKLYTTGKPTWLLTHGVDVDHFSKPPKEHHPLLANIPLPRVGYFGLFDERSDQALIKSIAAALPKISFVITGNIATGISEMAAPNIHFTGAVPYSELPAIVAGWDACILPYKQNRLTESINPLKLKEYIATGKPVVATPLPEICRMDQWVIIAENTDEWIEAIERVTAKKHVVPTQKIYAFISGESWEEKANLFLDKCLP